MLPRHHARVGAAARKLGRRRDGRVRAHAPRRRRRPKPARRRWPTTSARTSPSTTRSPKRSRSATTITARCSGPHTPTGCTACRRRSTPTASTAARSWKPSARRNSRNSRAASRGRRCPSSCPPRASAGRSTRDPAAGSYDNVLNFFEAYKTNPELAARGLDPVYPNDFVADLKNDELPQVSWVNVSLDETEHPGYSSAKVGEFIVESLLRRLKAHGIVGQDGAVPDLGRERRLLRPRRTAGCPRRHARRVSDASKTRPATTAGSWDRSGSASGCR